MRILLMNNLLQLLGRNQAPMVRLLKDLRHLLQGLALRLREDEPHGREEQRVDDAEDDIEAPPKVAHGHGVGHLPDDQREVGADERQGYAEAAELVGEDLGWVGVEERCQGDGVMEVVDEEHGDDRVADGFGLGGGEAGVEDGPDLYKWSTLLEIRGIFWEQLGLTT